MAEVRVGNGGVRLIGILKSSEGTMKPIYLDFHIHTSDNPDSPNLNYDLETLRIRVESIARGDNYLISFTDHNFVNEKVYLRAAHELANLILGVELHIRNYPESPAYHCHLLFNLEQIAAGEINLDSSFDGNL